MQEQIRTLFSTSGDYAWFEVIGCDGLIRKWRARTISIDFSEGPWTDVATYSITLGLQTDNIDDEDLHIDHTENWDVQFDENSGGIYTLSHTLSCQSEEFANTVNDLSDGWIQAKAWIDARLAGAAYTGTAPVIIKNEYIFESTGFNLTDYTAYDYTVQKSLDEYTGTYSITESWTLAKDPVFRTWNISYSDPRDDYVTVSVDGEFRSLLNRTISTETTPTNGDAALTAYNTWEDASGPFTEANAAYNARSGCGTLGTCPVTKSVTITEESRGDATATFGEATRTVQFSYEFSDSDADAEVSITRSTELSNLDVCETRVTISGQIQGHTCACGTTKLANAQTAYALIDCETEADDVYTGGGSLTQVRSTYSENEQTGVIDFSCEFTDRFDGGEIQEERITVGWVCGDLKTGGTSKTTWSVDGSIKAACDGTTPTAPDPSVYDCDGDAGCTLKRTSVVTDEEAKTVNYTYEWDNDDGPGLMEIVVEKTQGPDNCSEWISTVTATVQGIGCTSEAMTDNAEVAFNGFDPSSYAPLGSCQTSFKENKNLTRGSLQRTWTYTTECDASLNVTTTETSDASNCDSPSRSVEGEIKGHCGSGQMAAAETLFLDHQPDDYADGDCLVSSRIARNDKAMTIRFTYEFTSCTDGYKTTQTIDTKTDNQDCCNDVTIGGNITPFCDVDTGEDGLIEAGEAAWATVLATLPGIAATYCSETPLLRSTTVSRNQNTGQISYSYAYRCCDVCIAGALSESVNITKEFAADVVAIIPILGRTCGPIIQPKGTKTVEKCNIAIDLTFPKVCGCSYAKPDGLEDAIQDILSDAGCCAGAYGTYTERNNESWNPRTGKYTRNVTFICECC